MHRRLVGFVLAVLLAAVCALVLGQTPRALAQAGPRSAAAPSATSLTTGRQSVVLAQDEGVQLLGRPAALAGRPAPDLDSLTEAAAERYAQLPPKRVFFRGAICPGRGAFRSPVTLTFTLPKAVFSGSQLPTYRFDGHTWRKLRKPAVVGPVNTAASITIRRPGRYLLCLGAKWIEQTQDGYELVRYTGAVPRTEIVDPTVVAEGKAEDQTLINAVSAAGGRDQAWAVSTLKSYDTTGDKTARVIVLKSAATMVRNWSMPSTVGRWFDPYEGKLYGPADAIRIFALPNDNLATDCTLHILRPGAVLIQGVCADMTWDLAHYWPTATGGGEQLFGPKVSTYPPPAYDRAFIGIASELRWQQSEVADKVW